MMGEAESEVDNADKTNEKGRDTGIAKCSGALVVCPQGRIVAGGIEKEKGGHRTFSARMVITPAARDRNGAVCNRKASVTTGPRAKATTAVEKMTFMVACARGFGRCSSTWG